MTATTGAVRPREQGSGSVVQELDEHDWSRFVDGHPDGSIFHTPEMHRVFGEARHHRPDLWASVDAAGAIRALLTPVAITTIGGPLRAITTRAVAFAGPLASSDPEGQRGLEAVLRSYQEGAARTAVFTEIRHHVDPRILTATLEACSFRREEHLNFLVDLAPDEDALWARVASSARRNVRGAVRDGIRVEEAADPEDIGTAYEVLRDVYHRIDVPLPHRSLFDAASRILGPIGRFTVLLARLEERTIGVLTLLSYKDVATYWYAGTLREPGTARAGDLLAWTAIALARERGFRSMDLGGAGRPDRPYGVRDFKAKYGGRLVGFGRDVWVPSPLRMRLSTTGFELVRRFL